MLGKKENEIFPSKGLILVEFDLGIAISDFRIIFPSDNFTVEVDEFMVLLLSSLKKRSLLIVPFVFRRILTLKGL